MPMNEAAVLLPLWLCAAACTGTVIAAAESQAVRVELPAPGDPAPGEETWLRVRAGTLPRGAQLRVSAPDGAPLGTVSPFGAKAAQAGGAYLMPLPKTAVAGGRASLRVDLIDAAGVVRAPAASEIEGIELVNVPVSR